MRNKSHARRTRRDLNQSIAALAEASFTQAVFSTPLRQEHAIGNGRRIRSTFG
jgi:hypothetical protein